MTLDCTALGRDMAEAQVLGHVKGSFTGAHRDHPSPFEEADGGTLFLDEVGELPLDLQPKLLRVVDERVVQRVGSNHVRRVDVRIIAATHRNVAQMISTEQFRPNLYHRLSGLPVWLPPLRSRRADIRHLAEQFLDEFAREMGKDLAFTSEAISVLERLDWPGNVRELRQVVQRSAYLAEGDSVDAADLFLGEERPCKLVDVERAAGTVDRDDRDDDLPTLQQALEQARRDYCNKLLARTGSLNEAASLAGYSPRGLRMLLQRLKIALP